MVYRDSSELDYLLAYTRRPAGQGKQELHMKDFYMMDKIKLLPKTAIASLALLTTLLIGPAGVVVFCGAAVGYFASGNNLLSKSLHGLVLVAFSVFFWMVYTAWITVLVALGVFGLIFYLPGHMFGAWLRSGKSNFSHKACF